MSKGHKTYLVISYASMPLAIIFIALAMYYASQGKTKDAVTTLLFIGVYSGLMLYGAFYYMKNDKQAGDDHEDAA